jgi:inorganic pyrophosphatase
MIRVLVQVSGGSTDRRIYNERMLEYKETRRGHHPYRYPYGFVLGTRAVDGDSLDCYIITHDDLSAGSIVECEPIGMIEQLEDDEVDHKVLAVLLGQEVELNSELVEELRTFIQSIFADYPEMHVTVGQVLSRDDALRHIEELRESN